MSDDAVLATRRLRLKIALEELREMKGFGTELVTIIIPPDRQVSDARSLLQNEHGQAANIKSKGTRKNVQGAIESALSTLSKYKNAGENGIALFVGSIIIGNNKNKMVNIVIEEPPQSLISFRYRCDSVFELTQLEDMLIDKKSYGLFVIDRSEAAFGLASGKRIHVQEHLVSNIMGKHRQGGQSAQRFERLIEEAAHKFFKKSTELACDYWLQHLENIQGIIIGGPGATKDYVVKHGYFHHEVAKKIREPYFDVGYSNESGLRELVQRAGSLMDRIALDEERGIVDRFLQELNHAHPKATYGEILIRQALDVGAVDNLLLSEGLRKFRSTYRCQLCKHEWKRTDEKGSPLPDCPSCDASSDRVRLVDEATETLVDELTALAAHTSAKVSIISGDSEEGQTLMDAFGGMGAILRYAWS